MDHQKRFSSLRFSTSTTVPHIVKPHNQNYKHYVLWISLLFAAAVTFNSCVSTPSLSPEDAELLYPEPTFLPDFFEWQKLPAEHEIEYLRYTSADYPLIYHAVKINLEDPSLELVCYPAQPDTPSFFAGQQTQTFASDNNCLIAINASPYTTKKGAFRRRQLIGIHISNGAQLSPPNQRYAALSFTRTDTGWHAQIINSQTPQAFTQSTYAFGAFYVILDHGVEQLFRAANHDSRTAVGLSEDGKVLYILVAEGEKKSQSEGLSFQQCAKILKKMGCTDALEFDGGGSTQLCINGKSVLSYPNLRYQANSFGFR